MALVLRRTYLKAKNNFLNSGNPGISQPYLLFNITRNFSDDKFVSNQQFINSTIMIENGFNVQELPVIIRKIKDLSEFEDRGTIEPAKANTDTHNFRLIQEEFKQCIDLRDVFSLLSKCTKITPNIALGAMERIYDLEKNPSILQINAPNMHINLAKGAILDKLLKVVLKTEDTQTILNVLNSVSSFMEPYKHKFSDELVCRVIDNKLSIEQLCEFTKFLIESRTDTKYCDMVDKLWVGFVEKEAQINEKNIAQVFNILHGLKASKRIIQNLLEQKLSDLWCKINVETMQSILHIFIQEKYLSIQSFAVISNWLYANIHVLNEEVLLDIISKLTTLKYTDDQMEKSVEKYMKLKGPKINTYVLVVGILNYCMQFQISNKTILNACCEYFIRNRNYIPSSFLKSFVYPFGYLHFDPENLEFWLSVERIVLDNWDKMLPDDLCSIILSYIYNGQYPMELVKIMFSSEYLIKVKNPATIKALNLIDTALTLECKNYAGPRLPKDQWSKSLSQDVRIKNILNKTYEHFVSAAGGRDKISTAVLVPHLCSDETYLLDVMLHPSGLDINTSNWKSKSDRNQNTGILIHLPDHYCSDNEKLIGPQMMKKKHLKILGFKVVSLKYSLLSQFYTSYNINGLRDYLTCQIENAESCT